MLLTQVEPATIAYVTLELKANGTMAQYAANH